MKLLKKSLFSVLPTVFLLVVAMSCNENFEEPTVSLDGYKVEEGFNLEVVASEPFLEAPVQIDFDSQGRIWAVEMNGFMRQLDGVGENAPTGTIKILEDRDKDGATDHVKVFLDSLVMPRAISLVYGGVLYSEPPNLWFVEVDEDDKPVNRVLVDSLYALEGNPEYQPNGLHLNVDNWIYNAGSHFRYQRKNGEWIKEPTTYRGQWGITHDNSGRLYYNNNSTQLLGDYILPNRLVRNEFLIPNKGVNQKLTSDQRVYPLHAARVNRGYVDGVLNSDSLLLEVTAACAPFIYRGGTFPEGYDENAFVCIPEINAIKRNILDFNGDSVEAHQAWEGKEFLASTDEGFRPVYLTSGPDGSMYVVDMHRGVIQHQAFLSPYLKKRAMEAQLDTIINSGRILKVSNQSQENKPFPKLDEMGANELVQLLSSPNGYLRDQAQHRLVYKKLTGALPSLLELANEDENPIAQIHALNTLNGLEQGLDANMLIKVAENSSPEVVAHAIVLLEGFIGNSDIDKVKSLFLKLFNKNDRGIDLYLASTIGVWANGNSETFTPILQELKTRYPLNQVIQEALVSGMGNLNEQNREELALSEKDSLLVQNLEKNFERKTANKKNPIYVRNGSGQDSRTKGAKLYRQICAACHQADGTGAEGLAPPLVDSEHVLPSEKLGLIILHGLRGPIEVNGTLYDMNHAMPGLNSNETLSDKDISALVSYVTNAFSKYPKGLSDKKVKELRDVAPKEGGGFTIEELDETIKTMK
ncbi:c-type cytochrome [Cytophaga sp. FL35]|uniref:DUF7133 domain-containing protein n=1 Tax=Cytophaga sp. FL35 TaxID=1904456 RepID=UPI001653D5C6|nr:c-type cytochrome [Cytophaga sp. FL35]MBC6997856.1 c-type cytochrome [Cytophaga sp. FL35]